MAATSQPRAMWSRARLAHGVRRDRAMHRATLLLLLSTTMACGRWNSGIYDKLSLTVGSSTWANVPLRWQASRMAQSGSVRLRAKSMTCQPACEVALSADEPSAFIVTFRQAGPHVLEPIVEQVDDGVLVADEFRVDVVEAPAPQLEVMSNWSRLPVGATVQHLQPRGSFDLCLAGNTIPPDLSERALTLTVEPPGRLSVQRGVVGASSTSCWRVVAAENGLATITATLANKTATASVSVVSPEHITRLDVVEVMRRNGSFEVFGVAAPPLHSAASATFGFLRVDATTDDGRVASVEPRCLKLPSGRVAPEPPVPSNVFSITTTVASRLEWDSGACGALPVTFSLPVTP